MLVDHHGGDENGTRHCIVGDMYRKYLPLFKLAGPVSVLDLGANGGGFPMMLKLEGIDVARLVSVEMNPLTALRLRVNLNTNLGFSAVAINAAVCNLPEGSEIPLKPSRGSTGESMFQNQASTAAASVVVPTTTIQSLIDRFFQTGLVDLCKIDIEGAEYEVFDSITEDVLSRIRFLIIEFHDPSRTPVVLEKLSDNGFAEITFEKDRKTGEKTEVRVFRGPAA